MRREFILGFFLCLFFLSGVYGSVDCSPTTSTNSNCAYLDDDNCATCGLPTKTKCVDTDNYYSPAQKSDVGGYDNFSYQNSVIPGRICSYASSGTIASCSSPYYDMCLGEGNLREYFCYQSSTGVGTKQYVTIGCSVGTYCTKRVQDYSVSGQFTSPSINLGRLGDSAYCALSCNDSDRTFSNPQEIPGYVTQGLFGTENKYVADQCVNNSLLLEMNGCESTIYNVVIRSSNRPVWGNAEVNCEFGCRVKDLSLPDGGTISAGYCCKAEDAHEVDEELVSTECTLNKLKKVYHCSDSGNLCDYCMVGSTKYRAGVTWTDMTTESCVLCGGKTCKAEETCQNEVCVLGCNDAGCSVAGKSCVGNDVISCEDSDEDSCLEKTVSPCGDLKICREGSCFNNLIEWRDLSGRNISSGVVYSGKNLSVKLVAENYGFADGKVVSFLVKDYDGDETIAILTGTSLGDFVNVSFNVTSEIYSRLSGEHKVYFAVFVDGGLKASGKVDKKYLNLYNSNYPTWENLLSVPVSVAFVDGTVLMKVYAYTGNGNPVFELYEYDSGTFNSDDLVRTFSGRVVDGVAIVNFTINSTDLFLGSDRGTEEETIYKFYFVVKDGEGEIVNGKTKEIFLDVDKNAVADDETILNLENVPCGSAYVKDQTVDIKVGAFNTGSFVSGKLFVNGKLIGEFENGEETFSYKFSEIGNVVVSAETVDSQGNLARTSSNVLVTGPGKNIYVAACIGEPKDLSSVGSGFTVPFDATNTTGIYFKAGKKCLVKDSRYFNYYWTFSSGASAPSSDGMTNPLAYKFFKTFPEAGKQSASLEVEMDVVDVEKGITDGNIICS